MIRGLLMSSGISEDVATSVVRAAEPTILRTEKAAKKRVTRGARQARGKMSKALRQANSKARLKSGRLRTGWDQARVMKLAHKLKRKM